VFEEEDRDAVVGSPRVKQHLLLVECRFHHQRFEKRAVAPSETGALDWKFVTAYLDPSAEAVRLAQSPDEMTTAVKARRPSDSCPYLNTYALLFLPGK
jgi:hypothetical protein